MDRELQGVVVFHNMHTLFVLKRELRQMVFQVGFHLPLRFHHEAQAPFVAGDSRQGADGKRAGIPERIQQALAVCELVQTMFAPHQVVVFFLGRALHTRAYLRQFGGQRLTLIQCLGAHLAGMIDAHQTRHLIPFILG